MNILFLSRDYPPNLIGGVGIYTVEMSRQLVREGHNVFVITSAGEFESEYVDKGVRVFRVKPKRFRIFNPLRDKIGRFLERIEYSYTVSKKIREVVKKFGIDVVESCEARAEGFWYFLFHRRPFLVIKLHTPESIVYKLDNVRKNMDFKLVEYLENWWIERADKVIGLTDEVIRLTKAYFNIKKDHFPKVPNPIDINYFKPAQDSGGRSGNTILYVGRFEFRKGVHVLAKAMPKIIERVPDARFVFIGSDCGMRSYVLAKVKEYNCEKNVLLIDEISRDALIPHYQDAAVCVIPSLWENHPYVCLESMSCGKAVVASRIGGLAEIVKDGENGVLVTPGSFLDLAYKITGLLTDRDTRHRLGRNARTYMETHYSPEVVAGKTVDIYREILKKR